MAPVRVCFVCMGNICRSPMAAAMARDLLAAARLAEQVSVESAGTGGWHEGEPADEGKVGSVAMVKVGGLSGIKVVGSADEVWDVDWVAVEEDRESQRVKSCDGYQKVKGNVDVTQVDSLVKIFDRRTGKKIAEQTFQPKDECPSFAMVSKDNKAKAYVIDTDIEPWVRDTLDKQK